MMYKTIVLFDKDSSYSKRFFDYYESHNDFSFSLNCFSSIEELKKFSKDKKIDILISNEENSENLKSFIDAKKYLSLLEIPKCKTKNKDFVISKFQAVSDILSELEEHLLKNSKTFHDKMLRIISVFTPAAISSTTRLAIDISSILEKQEKSLYISLEEIPLINKILSDEQEAGISELLFFYKEKSLSPDILRKYIIKRRDLRFIPGIRDPNDLNIPSNKELIDFIKFIGKHSDCRNIILQCGSSISDSLKILEISDIIFMPVKSDYISKSKILYFKNILKKNKPKLYEKLIDVPISSSSENSEELLLNISGDNDIYESAKNLIENYINNEI